MSSQPQHIKAKSKFKFRIALRQKAAEHELKFFMEKPLTRDKKHAGELSRVFRAVYLSFPQISGFIFLFFPYILKKKEKKR